MRPTPWIERTVAFKVHKDALESKYLKQLMDFKFAPPARHQTEANLKSVALGPLLAGTEIAPTLIRERREIALMFRIEPER